MIARCIENEQLSFDIDEYLFDNPPRRIEDKTNRWATSQGKANAWSLVRIWQGIVGGRSNRTPLAYNPTGHESDITREMIHESTKDRKLGSGGWPCPPLKVRRIDGSLILADSKEIFEIRVTGLEKYMKGRIRTVHVDEEIDFSLPLQSPQCHTDERRLQQKLLYRGVYELKWNCFLISVFWSSLLIHHGEVDKNLGPF
jgi:hypothetical protein